MKDTVKARGRKTMIKLRKKVEFYPSVEYDRREFIRFHKISN